MKVLASCYNLLLDKSAKYVYFSTDAITTLRITQLNYKEENMSDSDGIGHERNQIRSYLLIRK